MGTRHSTRKGMPRKRNGRNYGGLASYFYDAQGDGLAPLPQSRGSTSKQVQAKSGEASFLGEWVKGVWTGPGPAPESGPPKRRHRSRSVPPGKRARPGTAEREKTESQIRHEHKEEMKKNADIMSKNFRNAHAVYMRNEAWPLHKTAGIIEKNIAECKAEIKKVRDSPDYKGSGHHKAIVEAVHATHINAVDFEFHEIYERINTECKRAKMENHLTLERPYHRHADIILYVNVVMAWLFAAKRQLMNVVEHVVQLHLDDPTWNEAQMFIQMTNHGRAARSAFEKHKHALGVKKHSGDYHLMDAQDLKTQHEKLYPAQA